jgi:hypothetical protein
MSGNFADDQEDGEQWLKEHKKAFPKTRKVPPPPPGHRMRNRNAHGRQRRPIPSIGKPTQTCPTCKRLAPIETFKNAKCLGCQAQDFLGTL